MGTSNGGSREKQVGVAAIENGQTEQGRASSSERLWNGVLLAELLTRRERVADLAPRLWGLGGSILGGSGGLAAGGPWGKPFNGPRGASSALQRSETPCSALRRPEMRCEALKCAVPCPAGGPSNYPDFLRRPARLRSYVQDFIVAPGLLPPTHPFELPGFSTTRHPTFPPCSDAELIPFIPSPSERIVSPRDCAQHPTTAWSETPSDIFWAPAACTLFSNSPPRSTTRRLSSTTPLANRSSRASRSHGGPKNDQEPDEEGQEEGAEKGQGRGTSQAAWCGPWSRMSLIAFADSLHRPNPRPKKPQQSPRHNQKSTSPRTQLRKSLPRPTTWW